MAWFTEYRRLTVRYERKAGNFLAFLILGASLTCYVVGGGQVPDVTIEADTLPPRDHLASSDAVKSRPSSPISAPPESGGAA